MIDDFPVPKEKVGVFRGRVPVPQDLLRAVAAALGGFADAFRDLFAAQSLWTAFKLSPEGKALDGDAGGGEGRETKKENASPGFSR